MPSPLFHLLLKVSFVRRVFVVGVSWPRRDLKQWRIAAEWENSKHNKIKIPQKLTFLFDIGTDLKYRKRILQTETTETTHLFFPEPRVGSDIQANVIPAYSVYLLSDDPEMSQLTDIYIFNILNSVFYLFVLFIYLSYIFILYIYLLIFIHLFIIFRRPPSAICIRRLFPHFTDTLWYE